MSQLDPSNLLSHARASSKCPALRSSTAPPLAPAPLAPAPPAPSARDLVQSLIAQMSKQRLERSRECALPYFAADDMIHAYLASRLKFCENSDSNAASGASFLGRSAISCLPLHAAAQAEQATLCEARAVALRVQLLAGSDQQSPWLSLPRGALLGSCTKLRGVPPKALALCLHDWFEQAFSESSNVTCDEWVEHDTLIVTRHDALSAWPTLGDMWHAFLAAAVFRLRPPSSRVLFADNHPPGPALPFWTSAFKAAAPAALQQLATHAARRGVRTLCFRRAIFTPSASTSALEQAVQHVGGRLACSDNLLLQAFAAHVRSLMDSGDMPAREHSAAPSLLILKHDALPPGSRHLFALLQQHFAPSLSIAVASMKHTPFADIVTSLSRASLLVAPDDLAAAFALYLPPLSACVSLKFAESPLLRTRLVTSWARIAHYKSAHPHPLSAPASSAETHCNTRAAASPSLQETSR